MLIKIVLHAIRYKISKIIEICTRIMNFVNMATFSTIFSPSFHVPENVILGKSVRVSL